MAILAIAKDLTDLRERIGKIIVAYDNSGKPITTGDLEVDGAMTALMARAINPNLMQTTEDQPCWCMRAPLPISPSASPRSSPTGSALKLSDYHVTESGFAADIGFEKFWNVKCRLSGLKPHCAVIVCHASGPLRCMAAAPGAARQAAYPGLHQAKSRLLEQGCDNMLAPYPTVKQGGINPVVCINIFTRTREEEKCVIKGC